MYDAVVVGAGPNGLAAAITLQQAGRSVLVLERDGTVGGAARTGEVTLPGFLHDLGAAVHPLGSSSPFFRSLPLANHGLSWVRPDIPLAHLLDGGRAVALHHSVEVTSELLEQDGLAYLRVIGRLAQDWERIEDAVFGPVLRGGSLPTLLTRFGRRGLLPAATAQKGLATDEARALLAGMAAHVPMPLDKPGNTAVALVLAALVHETGWPVAAGGSQAIVEALAAVLQEEGGVIETGRPVTSMDGLPEAGTVLFDTGPGAVAAIAGDRLSRRRRRSLRRYRHGPGAFKIDYALDGPVPWAAAEAHKAGTLHLGGSAEEIAFAEQQVWRGRVPERPFVIASQPSVADPARAPADKHVLWVYCHVPSGSNVDMTEAIERQIERFAPGFSSSILARHTMRPADLENWNPNLVGGDIAGGRTAGLRLLLRPRITFDPYLVGQGIYLCSSATPPGPGVHGMCGYHAAQSVLRRDR